VFGEPARQNPAEKSSTPVNLLLKGNIHASSCEDKGMIFLVPAGTGLHFGKCFRVDEGISAFCRKDLEIAKGTRENFRPECRVSVAICRPCRDFRRVHGFFVRFHLTERRFE